jgi:flagellar motility protein MotE (MotC chaperone)
MTKLLQFIGGFILSFLLIVGLFTGIFWYTKEYTPPPAPPVNVDSLIASGVWPDSLSMYTKERVQITQQKEDLASEKDKLARQQAEIAQREQTLKDIQAKINSSSAEEDSIMELRYTDLAQLVENMKPQDAGRVMDNLSDFSSAKILMKMRKRQAGRVMNSMTAEKLAKVSQLITLIKQ